MHCLNIVHIANGHFCSSSVILRLMWQQAPGSKGMAATNQEGNDKIKMSATHGGWQRRWCSTRQQAQQALRGSAKGGGGKGGSGQDQAGEGRAGRPVASERVCAEASVNVPHLG